MGRWRQEKKKGDYSKEERRRETGMRVESEG